MSLIRKYVTPRQLAANRANSRKSTGPRTELGKIHASGNAIKSGAFSKQMLASMKHLGEDPAEFQKLRQSLWKDLQPRDALEQLWVNDMAWIRWRIQRLHRAESGILGCNRRQLELDRSWRAHSARRDMLEGIEKPEMAIRGYANQADCASKYEAILQVLTFVRDAHLLCGFEKSYLGEMKIIYGTEASGLGNDLLTTYEAAITDLCKRDDGTKTYRIGLIMDALEKEIKYFEEELALYRAREVEVTEEMKDAQMLPSPANLDNVMRYEAHLERQFERKLQQLVAWRRAKGSPVPPQIVEPYVEER